MKALGEIASALAGIADAALIEEFLNEILTKSEAKTIALRWELLKELLHGKSQRAIAAELHVSLCKITRGSRELHKKKSALRKVIEENLSSNKSRRKGD
jgi:TrpR family trp operon transcriptional repressor